MKFFHYTSVENYQSMQTGARGGMHGLYPGRRLFRSDEQKIYGFSLKAAQPVIFGFLKPFHSPWVQKQYNANEPLLESIVDDIYTVAALGICLVEATVLPEDDAHVVNFSPYVKMKYANGETRNPEVVEKAKRNYWESLRPLAEYEQGNVSYVLPEVVCFDPIPLERMRIINSYDKNSLINHVRALAGLTPHPPEPARDIPVSGQSLGDPTKPLPPRRGSHLRLV
jgi:hypothetical protein